MEKQYKDENVTVEYNSGELTTSHYRDGEDRFSIAIRERATGSYEVDFPNGTQKILRTHQLRALVTFANELGITGYDLTESK